MKILLSGILLLIGIAEGLCGQVRARNVATAAELVPLLPVRPTP